MSHLLTSITRNRIAHTISRPATRAGLLALNVTRTAVPILAALLGAGVIEQQLAPDVTGLARVAYIALAAIVTGFAVDSAVSDLTDRAHRRLHARVYGQRSWWCEACGASITAHHWDTYDAAVFEQHLADPAAHGCTAAQ